MVTSTRKTIAQSTSVTGPGIHSGIECRVTLEPLNSPQGILLKRPGGEEVVADYRIASGDESVRRTVLDGGNGLRFEQIEHLMAAISSEGITDIRCIIEGPEVPFLGGGSLEYCEAIAAAGIAPLDAEASIFEITRPVALQDGDALVLATPHDGFRLTVYVEFPGTIVGSMGFSHELDGEEFRKEIAPARTFALASDIEKLKAAGLIKGGNLSNAVVFDHERYHNESLHFEDEVARHKIIDLLGDLALAGRPLKGHFWAWRAGHQSHVRFVQHLAREFNW